MRSYGFDANGRRTSLSTADHGDGNCAGTTAVTTTTSSFNRYDTADRPTLGIGGIGQYAYDAMGRQTTLPGVEPPTPPAETSPSGTSTTTCPRPSPRARQVGCAAGERFPGQGSGW